jgi:hypothetical protein
MFLPLEGSFPEKFFENSLGGPPLYCVVAQKLPSMHRVVNKNWFFTLQVFIRTIANLMNWKIENFSATIFPAAATKVLCSCANQKKMTPYSLADCQHFLKMDRAVIVLSPGIMTGVLFLEGIRSLQVKLTYEISSQLSRKEVWDEFSILSEALSRRRQFFGCDRKWWWKIEITIQGVPQKTGHFFISRFLGFPKRFFDDLFFLHIARLL